MKALIAVGFALTLAACQQNRPIAELSYTGVKELAVVINQRCIDQGVKPGTPQWDDCTKQEISRENSRRNRAARAADSVVVCNQVGFSTICL